MVSIARRGFFRRIVDAAEALFRTPEPPSSPPPPPPPPPTTHEPERLPPSMIFVPPELSGIPPTPEDELSPYEKVVFHEGFVDYDIFDTTGEYVVTDQYAADLIWQGWFDPSATPDDRVAARGEYFDYTGEEPSDFDWYDWRDWYESTSG